MSESIEHENPWRKLWEEVIDADCWDDEGRCRFCGMYFSENHKADCPFDRADTMLAEEIWNKWIHKLGEKENDEHTS